MKTAIDAFPNPHKINVPISSAMHSRPSCFNILITSLIIRFILTFVLSTRVSTVREAQGMRIMRSILSLYGSIDKDRLTP